VRTAERAHEDGAWNDEHARRRGGEPQDEAEPVRGQRASENERQGRGEDERDEER
jgi:hypothetical protein